MFADVLNTLYPSEGWKAHPNEARYVSAAGLSLHSEEIVRCESGYQLKLLIDSKRGAFECEKLENALSWVRLPEGQGSSTIDLSLNSVPQAHAAPNEEQHG